MVIVTSCSGGIEHKFNDQFDGYFRGYGYASNADYDQGTGDMMAAMMSIKITHSHGILDCVLIRGLLFATGGKLSAH